MNPSFYTRPATNQDADSVIDLLCEITSAIRQHEGWSEYMANSHKSNQIEAFKAALKTGVVFCVFNQTELVATVNIQLIPNIRHGWHRAHLEELVVKESWRGHGIGSLLLNHVKDYCKKNHIKVIKLLCGNQLSSTKKFYEKNGFTFTDTGYRFEIDEPESNEQN